MFPERYFPRRYFPEAFWPKASAEVTVFTDANSWLFLGPFDALALTARLGPPSPLRVDE